MTTLVGFSQSKTYRTKEARRSFFYNLAEQFNSPIVLEILKSDEDNSMEDYIHGNSEEELIDVYGTVVHELLHGYNGVDFDGHHYLIGPGERMYVPYTDLFSSKELNRFVKRSTQDSIVRYGLYVGGRGAASLGKDVEMNTKGVDLSAVMSVTKGIYGMVEEFGAYYYDALALFELYKYYEEGTRKLDTDSWERWSHQVYSNGYAYYEFKLFIGWYLMYAKEKHPDIYKQLYGNKPLRITFTILDKKFAKLLVDYQQKATAIEEMLKEELNLDESQKGVDPGSFRLEDLDEFEYNDNGKVRTIKVKNLSKSELEEFKKLFGMALNSKPTGEKGWLSHGDGQMDYLKSLFNVAITKELESFKVDGVTIENYLDFLK